MTLNKKTFAVLFISFLALGGCASSANQADMTVNNMRLTKQHEQSVSVTTAGGSKTSAMGSSNISDEGLKQAIEDSIVQSNLFNSVIQGNNADYALTVTITNLDKPVFGLNFTVNMEATWVLTHQLDNSIAYRQSILSSHTATFSDASAGVKRLRLAVEGAAKKNIERGLQAISKLDL